MTNKIDFHQVGGTPQRSRRLVRVLVKLLGGRSHYLFATAAAAFTPLFLGPTQVHLIGLAGYGKIVTVVLFAGMIASVANLGLSNAIIAKSATLDNPAQFAGSLMVKSALPSMCMAAAFFGGAWTAAWFFPNLSLGGLWFFAAGACAGFALSQSRLWLEGLRSAGRSAAYLSLSSTIVLFCPLVATLALYIHNDPMTYLVTWSVTLSVLIAAKTISSTRLVHPHMKHVSIPLGELIRFGSPLTLHSLVGTALAFSDRIAIAAYLGTAGVGQYQLATLAGLASVFVCNGLNLWWLPRIVSTPHQARPGALAQMFREMTAVVLVFSVLLTIGLRPFVDVVIADEAQRSTVVIIGLIIGIAALSQPLYLAGTNHLYASGRTGSLAAISITANIGQGIGTWMVVGRYGLLGVAIVMISAQWFQAISVGAGTFRDSSDRKNLAVSILINLLCVILLCLASSSTIPVEVRTAVQATLIALSAVVVTQYIRGRCRNQ